MYNRKIFLGGTCVNTALLWDWRTDLIKMLKDEINYFDPFIRPWKEDIEWDKTRQELEIKEREESEYTVYVITSDFSGIYSFCEATADSIRKPKGKCIVAFIDYRHRFINDDGILKSVDAFLNLCKSNGAVICSSITEIAKYLNNNIK